MAAPDLTFNSQADGDVLLAQLRLSDVEIFAAIWVYRLNLEDWEFVIVTPQLEDRGPRYLLKLADKILRGMDKRSDLTFFDLSFQSPKSHDVMRLMLFLDQLGIGLSTTKLKLADARVGNDTIGNIFVYFFDREKILRDNIPDLRLAAE